jgi:T4 superinfection immunity protein
MIFGFFVAIGLMAYWISSIFAAPGAEPNGQIFLWVAIGLYFLPTLMAILRRRSPFAVALLNTVLGWTGIGWFIALLWALA